MCIVMTLIEESVPLKGAGFQNVRCCIFTLSGLYLMETLILKINISHNLLGLLVNFALTLCVHSDAGFSLQSTRTMAPLGMVDTLGWFSSPEAGIISLVVFVILSITLVALCGSCHR